MVNGAYQGSCLGRIDLDGQVCDCLQELLGGVCLEEVDEGSPQLGVGAQEAQSVCNCAEGPGQAGQPGRSARCLRSSTRR